MTMSYTYHKAMGMQSEDAGLDFYIYSKRNWRAAGFRPDAYVCIQLRL